jgi:hypothetical protein
MDAKYIGHTINKEVNEMNETCCEIKCHETEDGFSVEIKGKKFKDFFESCKMGNFNCCGFAKEK